MDHQRQSVHNETGEVQLSVARRWDSTAADLYEELEAAGVKLTPRLRKQLAQLEAAFQAVPPAADHLTLEEAIRLAREEHAIEIAQEGR